MGNGLLAAEGAMHRRQRRVANPAFSAQNMRALVPTVFGIAEALRERWAAEVDGDRATLDVFNWIGRATFDVIGLAGFEYHFNALESEKDELFMAFRDMFEVTMAQTHIGRTILGGLFPFLDQLFVSHFKSNSGINLTKSR